MKYLNYPIIIAGLIVFSPISLCMAQPALETRIRDLERRVALLERQLGMADETPRTAAPAPQQPSISPSGVSSWPRESKYTAGRRLPLTVILAEKGLEKAGPGEKSDRLGFTFEFCNVSPEHITSFSGEIELQNAAGEALHSFPFDIAKYVTAGEKTTWFTSIPFSNVNAVHRKMYTSDISSLNAVLQLREVMYYDTRVEKFE